ncbi:hypothetical protein AS189_16445 [Arthrobacter alpinus]|uniref:Acyltransferase n=1 Tax=Arthrobacter alpinus TaxID=656366 RepID=A0A0S2M238_9MICC|nr:hypothetical protein AS189_16445 [Arthrobacter alpinus]
MLGWPGGGFIGVDIFFVISGFLITGQLVRQHERVGRISISEFYRARIRRILPASIVALIVVTALSFLTFRPSRAWDTLVDGVSAFFFSANWRFAVTGTDYWAADGAISPFQHFWSLGVEEQFYFVWPFVIIVVLSALAGKKASHRFGLAVIMGLIIVASFVWAVLETSSNPGFAYFNTFSRVWEMGVGALLAIMVPALMKIKDRLRPFIAWTGLAGIAASIWLINSDMAFPGPWAALPVASTALVIIAGTGGEQKFLYPITNKAAGFVGNISYSLYLWHFPVIIFMGEYVNEWAWPAYITALGLMVLLSCASYYFVEEPVRRSDWLLLDSMSSKTPGVKKPDDAMALQRLFVAGLAVLVAGIIPLTLAPPKAAVMVDLADVVSIPTQGATQADSLTLDSAVQELQDGINSALQATTWPALNPSLDDVMSEGKPDEEDAGCGTGSLDPGICDFTGGHDKSAVVLGDSTAIALVATARAAIGDEYNVRGLSKAGCVGLAVEVHDDRAEEMASCQQFKADSIAEILRTKPQIVFLTNSPGALTNVAGADGNAKAAAWQQGAKDTIEALKPSGAKVVIVAAPPSARTISICATKSSLPSDCVASIDHGFELVSGAYSAAAKDTGISAVDTRFWYCNQKGNCPAFAGATVVKRDTIHVTKQYSELLAPAFKTMMAGLS